MSKRNLVALGAGAFLAFFLLVLLPKCPSTGFSLTAAPARKSPRKQPPSAQVEAIDVPIPEVGTTVEVETSSGQLIEVSQPPGERAILQVETPEVEVPVPPGLQPGELVEIQVALPTTEQRIEQVILKVPIPNAGETVEVRTPSGQIVEVSALNSQPGTTVMLSTHDKTVTTLRVRIKPVEIPIENVKNEKITINVPVEPVKIIERPRQPAPKQPTPQQPSVPTQQVVAEYERPITKLDVVQNKVCSDSQFFSCSFT